MRIRRGLEALLLLVFLALLLLPRFVVTRNPIGPNTVFDTPLPVIIASLVYCTVVGIGKVMSDD